ncbi:site-specific DNA-methyltransferase [Aeromonas veronii]|uniref:site-specific DNA-methyltransferase n=1 Tax=Aeromonas TaxID=642 RepID=UPI0038E95D63
MEKLKMHSPNLVAQNIEQLAALFPNCVTESQGKDGELKRAIDFDLLKQELSTHIVDGPQERYQLNWPGKREALLTANAPIAKTLRPCREESVNFDTTQNLFIEGDNLDALKLLQETYLGKVKMIYIDPPYNTGNDFIYEDDFAEDLDLYIERTNQKDQSGNRLVSNTESNGRYHSAWLSMMYSRLKVARVLLKENGVIFISINEGEVHNLKKLCDEIFGEKNIIGTFVWLSKKGGGSDNNTVVTDQEYVLAYAMSTLSDSSITKILIESDPLDCEDDVGKYRRGRELNKWGANSRREDRPTMYFSIPGPGGVDVFPIRNDGSEGRWRLGKEEMFKAVKNRNIEFVKREDGTYIAYEKIRTSEPRLKPHRTFIADCGATADGSKLIKSLFDDVKVFDFPKPVDLIDKLLTIGSTGKSDVVLDFFAGSSTTAHSLMKLNAADGGGRKFIMIQLPEESEENSEAFIHGYKTISDVSKERIRRAGRMILENECHNNWNKDIGFRVLKIDSSNMTDVYYNPDSVVQDDLFAQVDNIKADRTEEDLLFQVMLDWGVDLMALILRQTIDGKSVFFVDADAQHQHGALVACFDKTGGIDDAFIRQLAAFSPLRLVFRDAGFASDAVKINAEQLLKQLSPLTEVKAI